MINKSNKTVKPGVIFIIASLVIPFINFNFILEQALMPKFLLTSLLLIIIAVYIIIKTRNNIFFDTSILRNKIFFFYFGFVLISCISVYSSILISEALLDSLKNFVFFIFFIIGVLLISQQDNSYNFTSKVICIFGLVAAAIGLYQIYDLLPDNEFNHQFTYLIKATFSQRNLYAQILILSFPFGVYLIITDRRIWRWIAVITVSIELLIIILLLVRSVWVAMAISTFFSVILLFVFYKKFRINLKLIRNLLLIAFAFALIIFSSLFIYAKLDSSETLIKQAYWLKKDPFGSVKERVEMWKYSTEMIKDKPMLGFGAGNWKIIIPEYANEEIRNINKGIYTNFQRAHNDYLQLAAETGILGLISYLLIFICIFFYLFKIIRLSEKQDEKLFALFMFFGVLSYVIISFFSFPKERISHAIILNLIFINLTVLYHRIRKPGKNLNPKIFKLNSIPVLIILLIAFFIGIKRINGEKHTRKAFEYRLLNKHNLVISEIVKAYSWFYQIDPTSTPIKWYSGSAWFLTGNLNNAYSDYNDAYKTNPFHKHVINDLATTYELLGNHEMSEKLYKEAISLSPHFDEALINLAIINYNTGNTETAYNYLRNCKADNENEKYLAALKVILPVITRKSTEEMNDSLMKSTFYRILDSEEWMLKIHKQSITDKHEYSEQLLIDAIYLLEVVDSTITTDAAEIYRKNYGHEIK